MTFWHSARMPDQHSLVTQGTADRDWLQDGATHYRELAHWLRGIAAGCRLPTAKRELIRLASRYNLRAEQFELRAPRRAHSGDRLG
jgi:hypothetical protein